jgi:hypothetical protein
MRDNYEDDPPVPILSYDKPAVCSNDNKYTYCLCYYSFFINVLICVAVSSASLHLLLLDLYGDAGLSVA